MLDPHALNGIHFADEDRIVHLPHARERLTTTDDLTEAIVNEIGVLWRLGVEAGVPRSIVESLDAALRDRNQTISEKRLKWPRSRERIVPAAGAVVNAA